MTRWEKKVILARSKESATRQVSGVENEMEMVKKQTVAVETRQEIVNNPATDLMPVIP